MWPAGEVINIIPARKRRTSANDIDTFLHGEKIWPYYWNPDIKSKVIWNTEIVIVWRLLYGHMKFMFMQKRTKKWPGWSSTPLQWPHAITKARSARVKCFNSGVGWRLKLSGISCHVSYKQTRMTINHAPLCTCNYFMSGSVYLPTYFKCWMMKAVAFTLGQ